MLASAALLASAAAGCGSEGQPSPDGEVLIQSAHALAQAKAPQGAVSAAYAPGQVLVRFKDVAGLATPAELRAQRVATLARIKGTFEDKNSDGIYDRFTHVDRGGHLMKVDLDPSTTVEAALATLRKDPTVAYAEPNYLQRLARNPAVGAAAAALARSSGGTAGVASLASGRLGSGSASGSSSASGVSASSPSPLAAVFPNDPSFNQLYALHNTGQLGGTADADIDAPEAWELSTGSRDIVVGVLDTGIDFTHADLNANMWSNPGEIGFNFVDDDDNGVVDDQYGYNSLNGSGIPYDDNAHGTHCGGIIGATGSNGLGVTGVSWRVSLMALKFLDFAGNGDTIGAIEAIDYALARKLDGVNLRVLSSSWGTTAFSQGLKDAIDAAGAQDILFVTAAGDGASDDDATPFYPASYASPNIVAVAATNGNDGLAPFSNRGATSVDLGAPGNAILSTTPNNETALLSGTAMAASYVAGAAALVLAYRDDLTTAQLKQLLLSSGDAKPALAGITVSGRRLNAANALIAAGPPAPHFRIAAAPATRTVNQAQATTFPLDLASIAGFTGNVALSVTSQPALAATLAIAPSSVTLPGTAQLSVTTTMATTPGLYTITVSGTSGAITRTRAVTLRVRPFGTIEQTYPSEDTPMPIPDNDAGGVSSEVHIAIDDGFVVQQVKIALSISHPIYSDLTVTATSPAGTTVTLHGASSANPNRTYVFPTQFAGEHTGGNWTVTAVDGVGGERVGTLNHWTLLLSNEPAGTAASFELAMAQTDLLVAQLSTAAFPLSVISVGGFRELVNLAVSAAPSFAGGLSLTPAAVTAPGSSSLSVSASCTTAPGAYALTIGGQSGALSQTLPAQLTVVPGGSTILAPRSLDTPRAIPDSDPSGTTSSIDVAESFPASLLGVQVDVDHPAIDELTVQLIAPSGQTVTLHDRSGSGSGLHRFYNVASFAGQQVHGLWRLRVSDGAGQQIGTLQGWTLRAVDTRLAPTAAFSFTRSERSFSFLDLSHDVTPSCDDGVLTSWHWAFGDGTTSSVRNPAHVYAQAGTYQVTLTVTDDDGNTASHTITVTATRAPSQLSIDRIIRNRAISEFTVDLKWVGAEGGQVELKRNGTVVGSLANDGFHTDIFRSPATSFTWILCEPEGGVCSNEVSVVFSSATCEGSCVSSYRLNGIEQPILDIE